MITWCLPQVACELIRQKWCFKEIRLPTLLFTFCFCLHAWRYEEFWIHCIFLLENIYFTSLEINFFLLQFWRKTCIFFPTLEYIDMCEIQQMFKQVEETFHWEILLFEQRNKCNLMTCLKMQRLPSFLSESESVWHEKRPWALVLHSHLPCLLPCKCEQVLFAPFTCSIRLLLQLAKCCIVGGEVPKSLLYLNIH